MLPKKKISQLPIAGTIDSTQDYFPIVTESLDATQKINRNTFLGVSGQPADISSPQTLTNKTLNNTNIVTLRDDRFTLQDNGDVTKQAQFQLSAITAGQTRILSVPDRSSTIATLDGSQTFTGANNFTGSNWTGGVINNPTLAVDSISGFTTPTNGNIYGLAVTGGKISGASIQNNSIPTVAYAPGSVNATAINFGGAGSGVWWEEIGRTTLTSVQDSITVNFAQRTYLQISLKIISSIGANLSGALLFNNDTGNNYAFRTSDNFGAGVSATSQNNLSLTTAANINSIYFECYIFNTPAFEKSFIGLGVINTSNGAANQIVAFQKFGKWANAVNPITRVDVINAGTGDYGIGSEIIVKGHN